MSQDTTTLPTDAVGHPRDDAPSELAALRQAVHERRVVLFAGAGVAMSIGLPSWQELAEHMARELQVDPDQLQSPDSFRTLAEYYRTQNQGLGGVRDWILDHWQVSADAIARSDIHRLIVTLDFPIIYTTNYDRSLEAAFDHHGRPYARIVDVGDLASAPWDATQIIKFHGDIENVHSMVMGESDYFDRIAFNAPLDVKLQADAFGHVLLFVGYSMSDPNIRMLLYRLQQAWQQSGRQHERPQCYVVQNDACPMQIAVLQQWGVTVLEGEGTDPQEALANLLRYLSR